MVNRCSDEQLLAGILQHRIERWLELEGVLHVAGFGDVELAGELDREPGAGPVYLRRLDSGQLWRADITMTARPSTPEEASSSCGPTCEKATRGVPAPEATTPGSGQGRASAPGHACTERSSHRE